MILGACGAPADTPDGGGADHDGAVDGDRAPDAAACSPEIVVAEAAPLALYVMLDQSGSMADPVAIGGDRWHAVTGALATFAQAPGATGVGLGLQYFGVPQTACTAASCVTDADCGGAACGPCFQSLCLGAVDNADSCAAADYATPEVEIAALPAAAPAIIQSTQLHGPSTATPTGPALQGAVDHAAAWSAAHPDQSVAVVLATDGLPTECGAAVSDLATIAAAGVDASPPVRTYVIAIGPGLASLDTVAAAGGTGAAAAIDPTADPGAEMVAALRAIRDDAAACTYRIPTPTTGSPDLQAVNVVVTPSGGAATTVPYVAGAAACPAGGDAWSYDDPAAPRRIVLCDATCGTVRGDAGATVTIALGCATESR
ncbi:MAG: hypothetical protein H6709_21145 [Kofleriaceae bacterium]|nr:hypothetical protein [Myxococcales bacterium]MCB9564980.1 hypothetical protein [Kofleriaceae bacterium]MCB9574591.1 hypothetical protein [Kofleriaceae bacterium]